SHDRAKFLHAGHQPVRSDDYCLQEGAEHLHARSGDAYRRSAHGPGAARVARRARVHSVPDFQSGLLSMDLSGTQLPTVSNDLAVVRLGAITPLSVNQVTT